ncbi:MAG: hypothetical protein M0P69_19365 [Bacteroidales bacterium]|jgi:hypothetical protein|nr:hypothetical protein [Bacteroidales bacterium]
MIETIFAGLSVAVIAATLFYISNTVRKIWADQQKHTRVLFGEDGISEWEGLITVAKENRKCILENRRAILAILNILIVKEIIDPSDPEILEVLKILRHCE